MPSSKSSVKTAIRLPVLKLQSAHVSNPVTYSFRFEEYSNWANVTINEQTGEFNLNSDWAVGHTVGGYMQLAGAEGAISMVSKNYWK